MIQAIKKFFGKGTDYKKLVESGAVIIDVRTSEEYKDGHIKTSTNIPLDKISGSIAELKKKNKPIITCCRSGARSGMAKSTLSAAGLEVYNGGAWNSLINKI
jgi:rhodanese-related sulfurtransferase